MKKKKKSSCAVGVQDRALDLLTDQLAKNVKARVPKYLRVKTMMMSDSEMLQKLLSGEGALISTSIDSDHPIIRSMTELRRYLSDDPVEKHKLIAEYRGQSAKEYNWERSTDDRCIAICKTGNRCKKTNIGSIDDCDSWHDGPHTHEELFCRIHDPETSKWEFKITQFIPEIRIVKDDDE